MRRALTVIAALMGILVAGLVLGRQLVLLVDSFVTEGEPVDTTGPFVCSPGLINVGDTPLFFSAPDGTADKASCVADATGSVALQTEDKVFALGPRDGASVWIGPYDVPFTPDPGDTVTLRVAHSVIAWPTPFDLNVMTGRSPSWRRNVYHTLAWRKSDGATLTMIWRHEQWLYDDWGSPMMTSPGRTGLVRVSGQ